MGNMLTQVSVWIMFWCMDRHISSKRIREVSRQLPVRESVFKRLRDYIERQKVRPVLTDVVSIAVTEYLDRQEAATRADLAVVQKDGDQ